MDGIGKMEESGNDPSDPLYTTSSTPQFTAGPSTLTLDSKGPRSHFDEFNAGATTSTPHTEGCGGTFTELMTAETPPFVRDSLNRGVAATIASFDALTEGLIISDRQRAPSVDVHSDYLVAEWKIHPILWILLSQAVAIPPNLPNQSTPSINWTGFLTDSLPVFTSSISLSCPDIVQQAKATCSTIRGVQDTDAMIMEATLLEFHATCEKLTSFCTFLQEMHADEYYAQGSAPIKVAFQTYRNNETGSSNTPQSTKSVNSINQLDWLSDK